MKQFYGKKVLVTGAASGIAREFELDVDRTQDVAGALQADPAGGVGAAVQRVPVTVRQRAQARLHHLQIAFDEHAVARDADLEGIGEHGGQ